ncbi:MAG: hypothetical protein GXX09_09340 [Syntrophomonadaceae bacterium]|nr:hypothetical protein [Syntrophomonadaceae bacterium]
MPANCGETLAFKKSSAEVHATLLNRQEEEDADRLRNELVMASLCN